MEINTCGLSCPQPVLMTMKAIEKNLNEIFVLADSSVACENIERLAKSKGYKTKINAEKDCFRLTLSKE